MNSIESMNLEKSTVEKGTAYVNAMRALQLKIT